MNKKIKVIFFGNGLLAEEVLRVLEREKDIEIVFHARIKEDLTEVKSLAEGFLSRGEQFFGVLASYGQILREDVLRLFEPMGILNIHPSLLPKYRGPAPIEYAILNGDEETGVSVMKIVKEMDAGPVYYREKMRIFRENPGHWTFEEVDKETEEDESDDDEAVDRLGLLGVDKGEWLTKREIYAIIGERGAKAVIEIIARVCNREDNRIFEQEDFLGKFIMQENGVCKLVGKEQEGQVSYTKKLTKEMGEMDLENKTAEELAREVRAYVDFPKSRVEIFGMKCVITEAREMEVDGGRAASAGIKDAAGGVGNSGSCGGGRFSEEKMKMVRDLGLFEGEKIVFSDERTVATKKRLFLCCADGTMLEVLRLYPEGKKEMDARGFINGYVK